jgi:LmbE family N-acetylglucosaminyl deacetylase
LNTAIRAVAHEARWDGTVAECPAWCPPNGDLLVVAAHPDDEVRGAGGLIHSWVARGGTVRVLSVSDGEPANPRCAALASARREELNEALRKLCPTHVAVTRLGVPLGRIGQHLNRLRNALLPLASGEVTLLAPNERAGHPDHEAVGRVCAEFARARGIALARYAIGQYGIGPGRTAARAGVARAGVARPGIARTGIARPSAVRAGAARDSGPRWVKFVLADDARRAKARAVQCFRARGDFRRGRAVPSPRPAHTPERTYEAFLV